LEPKHPNFSLNIVFHESTTTDGDTVFCPRSIRPAFAIMSSQPNPTLEEDLTHTRLSFEDGELDSHDISPPSSRTSTEKGKAKQSEEDTYDDEETVESSYPPTTDEAAETRRVEEVRHFRLLRLLAFFIPVFGY
jgi:hypothetical protein